MWKENNQRSAREIMSSILVRTQIFSLSHAHVVLINSPFTKTQVFHFSVDWENSFILIGRYHFYFYFAPCEINARAFEIFSMTHRLKYTTLDIWNFWGFF